MCTEERGSPAPAPVSPDVTRSIDGLARYLAVHYIGSVASGAISEQAFFVLAVLADGPCHGYGIVREVSELSEGRVHLKIGGLYGMLDRLVGEELIELDREEVTDGRLRRYYRLTGGGLEVLDAETDRMEAIASVARARLDRARPERARPARPSSRISPRVLGDGAAS